jgi:hypothetical protein
MIKIKNSYRNINSFVDKFLHHDYNIRNLLKYVPNEHARDEIENLARQYAKYDERYIFLNVPREYFIKAWYAAILSEHTVVIDKDIIEYYNSIRKPGVEPIKYSTINEISFTNNDRIELYGAPTLFYTSGTVDRKIVCLNPSNIFSAALSFVGTTEEITFNPSDLMLCCLPQNHIYEFEMELMALLNNVKTIHCEVSKLYENIMKYRPTIIVVVPLILNKFYEMKLPLPVRIIISGGAPLREEVKEFYNKDSFIINGYGSTETSASITLNGIPTKSVKIKLSECNEILVKGTSISDDFLTSRDGPGKHDYRIQPWFNTHDIGEIVDGKLIVRGRNDTYVKLQHGEYIDLDKLSKIYSRDFPVLVIANSLLVRPHAHVFTDSSFDYIKSVLLDIHAKNELPYHQHIDIVHIEKPSEGIYVDGKMDYIRTRIKFSTK